MNVATNHNLHCTIALAALQDVTDPEIGLNVVDMGLIYELKFNVETGQLDVLMTLSTQYCPMGQSIMDAVGNKLQAAFPGYTVSVHLTFDPPWNYEMISEAGRQFLNR